MSTTFVGPSWATTCAKIVFTECAVAPASVKVPASPSPALTGCHWPSGWVGSVQPGTASVDGPYQYAFRSYPACIAAARVNALNAEPASRPDPPAIVAKFSLLWAQSRPPAIARICPLVGSRSEEHTSELQSHVNLVCR